MLNTLKHLSLYWQDTTRSWVYFNLTKCMKPIWLEGVKDVVLIAFSILQVTDGGRFFFSWWSDLPGWWKRFCLRSSVPKADPEMRICVQVIYSWRASKENLAGRGAEARREYDILRKVASGWSGWRAVVYKESLRVAPAQDKRSGFSYTHIYQSLVKEGQGEKPLDLPW